MRGGSTAVRWSKCSLGQLVESGTHAWWRCQKTTRCGTAGIFYFY